MNTYIVRVTRRPGQFSGVVSDVTTGTRRLFADPESLVAALQADAAAVSLAADRRSSSAPE